MIGFGFLFGSLYPLTQIYQFEEDSTRGDWTLARMMGVSVSLAISAVAAALAFAAFARALWLAGPTPTSRGALLVAFTGWVIVLGQWLLGHPRMTSAEHKRGMYRALAVWGLTDVAVVVAFAV